MSVSLYRDGNTHIIRGVACEMQRFSVGSMAGALANGWRITPQAINEAPTQEEADTNDSGKLSSEEVRAAAREAGIDGWDSKRINTLKAALGYV